MKNTWMDRVLLFVAGVFLTLTCAGTLLLTLGAVPTAWLSAENGTITLTPTLYFTLLGWSALALALGVYAFTRSLRGRKTKSAFVVQETENGELRISIKAMENLVQKCVDMHDELHVVSTQIENTREGVEVSLRISLANNVSIPLAVTSLQKQIKQYIVACSGVDVREVHVSVETASGGVDDSPYLVPEIIQAPPKIETEERQSLHQRIFGKEEQPAQVPVPPVMQREDPSARRKRPRASRPSPRPPRRKRRTRRL